MRQQDKEMKQVAATLYIHFPFCRSKCAYCDFYSSAARGADFGGYVEAVAAEWRLRRMELPSMPETVYLGGGTPSMLGPEHIARLSDLLARDFDTRRLAEFTIEANPEDITPETLAAYSRAGINRVSIGVQSFDTALLEAVSRRHSPEQAVEALTHLSAGGWNYSADLIYGLPEQTTAQWENDLRRLLDFRPPHLSAYLLSYEPGTALYARRERGLVAEASDSLAEQMYEILCRETARAGYRHYEISNFALPGYAAVHNSAYWDGTPYLGLGPGAHSLGADGLRRYNPPGIKKYVKAVNSGSTYFQTDDEDDANRVNDTIITALRTASGLDPQSVSPAFRDEFGANARRLLAQGLLVRSDDGRLTIPERLWLRSDAILRDLIVG